MRNRQTFVLTVGQTEGDLQGKDDKIIQAGIEYLDRLGGGTLRLLPGTYTAAQCRLPAAQHHAARLRRDDDPAQG